MTKVKPVIELVFDTPELCDEFRGWMSDGGGEQQFSESCDDHGVEYAGIDYDRERGWHVLAKDRECEGGGDDD